MGMGNKKWNGDVGEFAFAVSWLDSWWIRFILGDLFWGRGMEGICM